jgi:hypothetical protein
MRQLSGLVFCLAASMAAAPASAELVVRMGNTVYVDGKAYDWEAWKKIRDDPSRLAAKAQPASGPAQQAAIAPTGEAAIVAADGPRAASCVTVADRDEFPSEEERFQCSAGLGRLTRDEILRAGWKIDLIEKTPSPAGQSARGLPVYRYKLVISR